MRDGSANQLSARTPEAKSLSGDILAVTAYGSGFCLDRTYPKDGKSKRTKILEAGIEKKCRYPYALPVGSSRPTPKIKIPTLPAKNAARTGRPRHFKDRTSVAPASPKLLAVDGLLLGYGIQEGEEFVVVFGEHAEEVDSVAELGVGGDDSGLDEKRVGEFQFEFEVGADREWIHALDVASVEAEVGGGEVDGSVAAFGVNFDGQVQFKSRVLAPFDKHGPGSLLHRPLV